MNWLHTPFPIEYVRAQAEHVGKEESGRRTPQLHIHPICCAGTPTMMAYAGTSCVTTAPAPMNEYSPSATPQTIVEFAPIEAPRFTNVRRYSFLRST
jgi:hypothetical protein